jgi:hypothetical protein
MELLIYICGMKCVLTEQCKLKNGKIIRPYFDGYVCTYVQFTSSVNSNALEEFQVCAFLLLRNSTKIIYILGRFCRIGLNSCPKWVFVSFDNGRK